MSIYKEIKTSLIEIINNAGYKVDDIIFQVSGRKDLGDYQINDAMRLAGIYKKSARDIAEEIAEEIKKDAKFASVEVAGPGFINIKLSSYYLLNSLNKVTEDINLNIDKVENKLIFMDYGGANIAKTLHVGHLRSANIGEAVKRLTKYLGCDVISDVHFGDIGRQSGMVISEIKRRYPNLDYFNENYNGDYNNIEFYITPEELGEIYPTASLAAKADEERLNEVVEITKELENGNPSYTALWNKIKEVSIDDIKGIYKEINTNFDLYEGESDCYPYIPKMIEKMQKDGYLRESEDAQVIDVAKEDDKKEIPPLVVIKSNGATLYATRDLATIISRMERFSPDEIWYFTDKRQSLYFEQVIRASYKTKIVPETVKLKHYGFGTMNGTDGKPFKTRDGGVMDLKTLINDIYEKELERINKDIVAEANYEKTAKKIGVAALKYADLLCYRETDYIFDSDKFLSLEGKTGPYLLYSSIRMKSLLDKSESKNYKFTKLKGNLDRETALVLLEYPIILTKCFKEKSLNELTDYAYRLTNKYNNFYNDNKILTEVDNDLKNSWLALTALVYKHLTEILNILGMEIPEKM